MIEIKVREPYWSGWNAIEFEKENYGRLNPTKSQTCCAPPVLLARPRPNGELSKCREPSELWWKQLRRRPKGTLRSPAASDSCTCQAGAPAYWRGVDGGRHFLIGKRSTILIFYQGNFNVFLGEPLQSFVCYKSYHLCYYRYKYVPIRGRRRFEKTRTK